MSSSGFVPFSSSKRVRKEYGVCERTPLSDEMVPLPSLRLPFQMAEALRFMIGKRFGWVPDDGEVISPATPLSRFSGVATHHCSSKTLLVKDPLSHFLAAWVAASIIS